MELSSPKIKNFQERTFQAQKKQKKPTMKKFLIFRETELFSPKLKKLLCFFRRDLAKPKKTKFSYISLKKLSCISR